MRDFESSLVPLLRTIQFFKERKLKDRDLLEICKRLKHQSMGPGQCIINAGIYRNHVLKSKIGEFGDKFYIVLKGRVSVNVPIPKQQQKSVADSNNESIVVKD